MKTRSSVFYDLLRRGPCGTPEELKKFVEEVESMKSSRFPLGPALITAEYDLAIRWAHWDHAPPGTLPKGFARDLLGLIRTANPSKFLGDGSDARFIKLADIKSPEFMECVLELLPTIPEMRVGLDAHILSVDLCMPILKRMPTQSLVSAYEPRTMMCLMGKCYSFSMHVPLISILSRDDFKLQEFEPRQSHTLRFREVSLLVMSRFAAMSDGKVYTPPGDLQTNRSRCDQAITECVEKHLAKVREIIVDAAAPTILKPLARIAAEYLMEPSAAWMFPPMPVDKGIPEDTPEPESVCGDGDTQNAPIS